MVQGVEYSIECVAEIEMTSDDQTWGKMFQRMGGKPMQEKGAKGLGRRE